MLDVMIYLILQHMQFSVRSVSLKNNSDMGTSHLCVGIIVLKEHLISLSFDFWDVL